MDRCQAFARRYKYVLKAIKIFRSIDHQILKALIARKIKDPDVLWLTGRSSTTATHSSQRRCGSPEMTCSTPHRRTGRSLGNWTAKFFANVCLVIGHYVTDRLGLELRPLGR